MKQNGDDIVAVIVARHIMLRPGLAFRVPRVDLMFRLRPGLDRAGKSCDRLSTTGKVSTDGWEAANYRGGTNLVYAITVKDVLAFGQLSNLFGHLVVAKADQTAVSIRNRDGNGAV